MKKIFIISLITLAMICCFSQATDAKVKKSKATNTNTAVNSKQKEREQKANNLLEKAQSGDAEAQYQLAILYSKGEGVVKDWKQTVYWFRKAAEQEHLSSYVELGNCYKGGHGVQQDYNEMLNWYRKAADKNFADAQVNLRLLLFSRNWSVARLSTSDILVSKSCRTRQS